MGWEKWFKEDIEAPVWKSVPHAYETNMKKKAYRTGGFDKAQWFSHSLSQETWYKNTPGPLSYNNDVGTIETHARNQAKLFGNRSAGRRYQKYKVNPYFKELEKGFKTQATPGPAAYQKSSHSLSTIRRSVDISFSKVSRMMFRVTEVLAK